MASPMPPACMIQQSLYGRPFGSILLPQNSKIWLSDPKTDSSWQHTESSNNSIARKKGLNFNLKNRKHEKGFQMQIEGKENHFDTIAHREGNFLLECQGKEKFNWSLNLARSSLKVIIILNITHSLICRKSAIIVNTRATPVERYHDSHNRGSATMTDAKTFYRHHFLYQSIKAIL